MVDVSIEASERRGEAGPGAEGFVRPAAGAVRACLFWLAGKRFAIEVQHAREVIVLDEFTIVPRPPAYVVGVANLRGLVRPLLGSRRRLRLAPRPVGRGTRVLVVDGGTGQVGIAIDATMGLESFDELIEVGEAADPATAELAAGLLKRGDDPVILLDVGRVLDALKSGSAPR